MLDTAPTDDPAPADGPAPTADPAAASRLRIDAATLAYDRRVIAEALSVAVPPDSFTVILGPNACGKSTTLRALSRLLKPAAGTVILDGRSIHERPAKEVARTLGLLPQSSTAPPGITVASLVARGRYPHQKLVRVWSDADEGAVNSAMDATGVRDLADRQVDQLSGGQRQRVWVAMALAQETPILLLDEPTTYLDVAYQIDLLNLFARLHRQGTTLVAVLHDLNHAARYATHLVVMKAGRVIATGAPAEVMTAELVEEVYGLPCIVIDDPITGTPLIVPKDDERQAANGVAAVEAAHDPAGDPFAPD